MFNLVKSLFSSVMKKESVSSEDEEEYSTPSQFKQTEVNDEPDQTPNGSPYNDSMPIDDSDKMQYEEKPKTYGGALYLVKGLQFETLMEECEASFENQLFVFQEKCTDKSNGKTAKRLMFRLDHMYNIRQHLSDAFQFIVKSSKDSGEEYGFQMNSMVQVFKFRRNLYTELLQTCSPLIEVECAIGEYDTNHKAFVVISQTATASILKQSSLTDQHYLVVSDFVDGKLRIVFVEALTRGIQIWPSPQTHQITCWGVRFQRPGHTKTMFLLEINPKKVSAELISGFLEAFARILQDRSFLLPSTDSASTAPGHSSRDSLPPQPMEDDGFDVGNIGDPSVQRAWRRESSEKPDDESDSERYDFPTYNDWEAPVKRLTHRFMEVGSERTFVCRGDQTRDNYYRYGQPKPDKCQLKVYKREQGEGENILESVGSIDGNRFNYKGQAFAPGHGLLHQEESKLLLVPEHDTDGDVYMMDLNAETVVQHWNADGLPINSMFPTIKQGQRSHDPTFLCTNSQNLFLMDTRLPGKGAKSTSYSYKTNPQLSVGATDSQGHILTASRLGELRLFDGTVSGTTGDFKRAKTLLQTVKEPITAIDVTRDGSWIVATTKTYLMVFPTRLAGTGKTGFEVSLGQNKPNPRYLMLTGEDVVKYGITEIDFAPARFDAEEESIVTSTGNMAVVWDLGTVKRGKPFYSVRFANDTIKDVQITADCSDVVVAYPTAVGLFETEKRRI